MLMEIEYIIVSSAIVICAFALLIVAIGSYRRYQNYRIPFLISVFAFFLIKGIFFSLSIFFEPFASFSSSIYAWVIDLIILNLLYLAALKR